MFIPTEYFADVFIFAQTVWHRAKFCSFPLKIRKCCGRSYDMIGVGGPGREGVERNGPPRTARRARYGIVVTETGGMQNESFFI